VYRLFPCWPEQLSTDLTSLNEAADRAADSCRNCGGRRWLNFPPDIYRAWCEIGRQLTYNGVGPWLEVRAGAAKVAGQRRFAAQLKLQMKRPRRSARAHRLGALRFDRIEAEPVITMAR